LLSVALWPQWEQAAAGVGAWAQSEAAAVRLLVDETSWNGGNKLLAGVQVRLAPGWKTYWRSPGAAGLPPEIDWSESENVAEMEVLWPAPRHFELLGIELLGYEKEVVLPVWIQAVDGSAPLRLRAKVSLLVCSDICVPADYEVSLPPIMAGETRPDGASAIHDYLARVPDNGRKSGLLFGGVLVSERQDLEIRLKADPPLDEALVIVEGNDGNVATGTGRRTSKGRLLARVPAAPVLGPSPEGRPDRVTITVIAGNRRAEFSAPVIEAGEVSLEDSGLIFGEVARKPLMVALVLGLVGGLILNLMPCVLPVLSLKLLSVLSKSGKGRGEIRRGFLWSALGVLSAFWLFAGLVILLKQAGVTVGWGMQFQQPVFLAVMIVLLTAFGANLLGFFQIALPGGLTTAMARMGKGHLGDFCQGGFAAALATPCSAPFLGTAVGFALAGDSAEIFSVFTTVGLGLALPYLAVAGMPGLAGYLPRPGPWMGRLKLILSLALFGTALWLLSVLNGQISLGFVVLLGALMPLVLALLWGLRGYGFASAPLIVAGMLASALLVVTYAPRNPTQASGSLARASYWEEFRPAEIPRLVQDGKVVFVDITADWCITCIVNKAAALDRDEVAEALKASDVIAMQGDWTNPDPVISDFLARHGRYGIPFNVVYGLGAPEGVLLPELLAPQIVLSALEQAAGLERDLNARHSGADANDS
jgi:suppressor for copper-sensitivity B